MKSPEAFRAGARRPKPRPEFHQLEVFLRVVETGSFSAAARQLGKTQPAISQTIARLEESFGYLFERRNGVPLGLTPIGKAILPSVHALLFTADELMNRAIATAQGQRGTLTIGLDASFGLGPLRNAIRDLKSDRPDVRLRVIESRAGELHSQLNDGEIDVMFVIAEPRPVDASFARELLLEERLMLVMREDHPLAAQSAVSSSELSSIPLIIPRTQLTACQAVLHHNDGYDISDISCDTLFDLIAMGLEQTIALQSAITPKPGIVARPIQDDNAILSIEGIWPQQKCHPLRDRLLYHVRKSGWRN